MNSKEITQEEKNKVKEACKIAMPHSTISVSTGIVTNTKYLNEEFISFDILIPMSIGMDMQFREKGLEEFDFFYTFESGVRVRLKDVDPYILDQMFKEKFLTVCFQKQFIRGTGKDIFSIPVAFSIEEPNIDYEEGFLQHVGSFLIDGAMDLIMRKKEQILKAALTARKVS